MKVYNREVCHTETFIELGGVEYQAKPMLTLFRSLGNPSPQLAAGKSPFVAYLLANNIATVNDGWLIAGPRYASFLAEFEAALFLNQTNETP